MKCPYCEKDFPGIKCGNCNKIVCQGAYCMECGSKLGEIEGLEKTMQDEEDVFDIKNRVLCPDGTCTGIIVDGKCIECGKHVDVSSI